MIQWFDSHCHLDYDYDGKTTETLLEDARAKGVVGFTTIGTEVPRWPALEAISEKFDDVFHTIGVHPHDSKDLTDEGLVELKQRALHPKCRAIGEIGLDYHYDHSPRETQKKRLDDQLEIAIETKQPIVIHSREGEDDLLVALKRYAARSKAARAPGIIHCFSGTEKFARGCLDLGFLISISGIVTFKKSQELRTTIQRLPIRQLLVETDAPFLAPEPFRGKKCEPAMVVQTGLKLAELFGVPAAELAAITTKNAHEFFRVTGTA